MDLNLCPCGSQKNYSDCCERVIYNHHLALTAEQLMRSRYSGFVKEEENYIRTSWHESSRPRSLNFADNPVSWVRLEIHNTEKGMADDTEGKVEFSSYYIEDGKLCELREISDFVKENNLWFYLRGECEVKKHKLERNHACPCGSGKKFKKCCINLR